MRRDYVVGRRIVGTVLRLLGQYPVFARRYTPHMEFSLRVLYDGDEDEFVLTLTVPDQNIDFSVPMSREEVWSLGKHLVAAARASREPGEN